MAAGRKASGKGEVRRRAAHSSLLFPSGRLRTGR